MSTLDASKDTVIIDRLRIRSTQHSTEPVPQRLTNALEWADWPEAPGESWVFIRKIKVSGNSAKLPEKVLEQAGQLLQSRPDGDNLVRFANLTELLAALLTDIAQGRLQQHWYWQRFSHLFGLTPSGALLSVMREQLERLGSVFARLAQQRHLLGVLEQLDPTDAQLLVAEMGWRSGIALPDQQAILQANAAIERLIALKKSDTEAFKLMANEFKDSVPPALLELHLPASLKSRWAPLLQQFSADDSRSSLILMLIGQEIAPIWLKYAPAAVFAHCQRELASTHTSFDTAGFTAKLNLPQTAAKRANSDPIGTDTGLIRSFSTETEGEQAHPSVMVTPANSAAGFSAESALEPPVSGDYAAENADLPGVASYENLKLGAEDLASVGLSGRLRLTNQATDTAFGRFHTHQGGLLYLLNLLNMPAAQQLMETHWQQLPNGWLWLYRLGQELELDEKDALVSFIALQLGCANQLALAELPHLPCRDELLALALKHYGKRTADAPPLWLPSLLKVEAQIHHSPTHIDLYAPLNAIRLPVRLAGLDINPGWLPWLGRVVNFHYGI